MPSAPILGITGKDMVVISEQTVGGQLCHYPRKREPPRLTAHGGMGRQRSSFKHTGGFNVTAEKNRARASSTGRWAGGDFPRGPPLWQQPRNVVNRSGQSGVPRMDRKHLPTPSPSL